MRADLSSCFDSAGEIQARKQCPIPVHIREINERIRSGMPLLQALDQHFADERFQALRFGSQRTVKNQICAEVYAHLRLVLVMNPMAEFILDRFFRSYRFQSKSRECGRMLSQDELLACIKYSGAKTSLFFEFLYLFAGRVSEACAVRLSDIEDVIHDGKVDPQVKRVIIREGKTDAEAKVLVESVLLDRIRHVFGGQEFLFETQSHKQYRRQDVYNLMVDAAERILGARVTPHDMRRTFGDTMTRERPLLEEKAMRHGRWKDRNTFRGRYTRPTSLRPDEIPFPVWDGHRVGYRGMKAPA